MFSSHIITCSSGVGHSRLPHARREHDPTIREAAFLSSTMDAKFHLCLLVILLGAITVQGARPEMQEKKNPMDFLVFLVSLLKARKCIPDYG